MGIWSYVIAIIFRELLIGLIIVSRRIMILVQSTLLIKKDFKDNFGLSFLNKFEKSIDKFEKK